jgi:hypothetical protein
MVHSGREGKMRIQYSAKVIALWAALTFIGVIGTGTFGVAAGRGNPECAALSIDVTGDQSLHPVTLPPTQQCTPGTSNGFPIPDPHCTPGAINPTVTLEVLTDPNFRTSCYRNGATSAAQKNQTYVWYGIDHPANNTGRTQTCELDHLVSLELGGADTLDNLWPQCGPDGATLAERYFKEKDAVENYLAAEVKAGRIVLADAQKGIATNWTQYLHDALDACPGGRCGAGR